MAEEIDMQRLGRQLRRLRRKRGLTLKEVYDQTGITVSTLSRIERRASKSIESGTLLTLAQWMGTRVEKLNPKPEQVKRGGKVVEETPDIVELYLRADKKIDRKTAAALSRMFRAVYEELSQQSK